MFVGWCCCCCVRPFFFPFLPAPSPPLSSLLSFDMNKSRTKPQKEKTVCVQAASHNLAQDVSVANLQRDGGALAPACQDAPSTARLRARTPVSSWLPLLENLMAPSNRTNAAPRNLHIFDHIMSLTHNTCHALQPFVCPNHNFAPSRRWLPKGWATTRSQCFHEVVVHQRCFTHPQNHRARLPQTLQTLPQFICKNTEGHFFVVARLPHTPQKYT